MGDANTTHKGIQPRSLDKNVQLIGSEVSNAYINICD